MMETDGGCLLPKIRALGFVRKRSRGGRFKRSWDRLGSRVLQMLPHVFIFIDSLSMCNTFRPNHRALTSLHQFLANVSLMTVVLAVVPILLRLNRDPWKNDFFLVGE